MANGKAQLPDYQGYVQIELNEDDRDKILEATKKMADIWKEVDIACNAGFKFSIQKDTDPLFIKATLMDLDKSRSSAGWMLSGQGSNVSQAVAALMYKHVAKMDSKWTPFLAAKREVHSIR